MLLVIGVLWQPWAVFAAETVINLGLNIGDIRVLPIDGVARVAVGDSKVVNAVTDDDREVILFAKDQGQTTLEIWNTQGERKSYQVVVKAAEEQKLLQDIRRILIRIPKVRANVVGDKVIVEGDSLSDADRERVLTLAKHYPQIIDMTSQVGWDQMVLLDVQILELPRNYLHDLGVNWSATSTGGLNAGLVWDAASSSSLLERVGEPVLNAPFPMNHPAGYFGVSAMLSSSIQAMASQGEAVILAQPQLMARSGATAEFLAGGEVPYSVSDNNGNTQTIFKPYGVSLYITPRIEKNGTVRSKINVEVSSVDASFNLAGGPALKTRRTSTEFNVRSGETLVLAGFISRDQVQGSHKVPGFGDTPILSALFKSRKFQNNETELAIFVRPVVVSADNKDLQKRVDRSRLILDSTFEASPVLNVHVGNEQSQDSARIEETEQAKVRKWKDNELKNSIWNPVLKGPVRGIKFKPATL
ncbi:MAG: secretion protein [Alcaligenaceae bacterium]|nr:secretion protein [Alcaligenaceae bacterium]